MTKNIKDLFRNLHFVLKLMALMVGIVETILVIVFRNNVYFSRSHISTFGIDNSIKNAITNRAYMSNDEFAYVLTFLSIISALLITYIFFESTKFTEMFLLISGLIAMLNSMLSFHRSSSHGENETKYIVFMMLCSVGIILVVFDIAFHILEK